MTKGYKATYNYQCLDQTYEIGQEYKLDENPIICQYGFHYCINAKDTLNYYSLNSDFKLLEIEDLNPNDTITYSSILSRHKSCSNHIRIVREITDKNELYDLLGKEKTFDKNGRELTYKDSNGFWREFTYNEDGKELTYKDSDGNWYEKTYDQNGNFLKCNSAGEFWYEYTYDENGNTLTYKDSDGFFNERTYDKNGNELTYE